MVKGINAKESNGFINLGIHVQDFIKSLLEIKGENKEWVNISLKPRKTPDPRGYTHSIEVTQKNNPPDGSTKG